MWYLIFLSQILFATEKNPRTINTHQHFVKDKVLYFTKANSTRPLMHMSGVVFDTVEKSSPLPSSKSFLIHGKLQKPTRSAIEGIEEWSGLPMAYHPLRPDFPCKVNLPKSITQKIRGYKMTSDWTDLDLIPPGSRVCSVMVSVKEDHLEDFLEFANAELRTIRDTLFSDIYVIELKQVTNTSDEFLYRTKQLVEREQKESFSQNESFFLTSFAYAGLKTNDTFNKVLKKSFQLHPLLFEEIDGGYHFFPRSEIERVLEEVTKEEVRL